MLCADLKEIVHYDPFTGYFTSLVRRGSKVMVGDKLGSENKGYLYIMINYNKYLAHRLAWFYMNGEWPKEIDHINGNPSDNRWANLRVATHRQNLANCKLKTNNSTGYKGVSKNRGKYQAQIRVEGKRLMLGRFNTMQEASVAYEQKAVEFFGEYHRVA